MTETALQGPIRVRFAPSPTGFLHVGGARTAIYNDLLRAHLGGELILRIEDTDRARSDEAMTRQIQEALEWVGCHWDEGPALQSARVERHRERAAELLARDLAYRCFCTSEELDAQRRAAEKAGERFRYPGTCSTLSAAEVEERLAAGTPFVVRFRMAQDNIRFHDLVRGDVDFPPDALDDFILLRSDGSPTYHLSVVSDDIDMRVSHIIRGDDHLSNTPKHIALFEALEAPLPTFGHLPLILGPDKKRLSKRTGATSVEEFRDQGILPQALYNFLALLGWSPGDAREILSRDEMTELFTVERLNTSAAVFDRDKLAWMNAQYLFNLPLEEIWPHLEPFLAANGLADADPDRLEAAVTLHRLRAHNLAELAESIGHYFVDRLDYDPALCAKFAAKAELPERLAALRDRYDALDDFAIDPLDQALRALCEEFGEKAGYLIHPLRMALSASKKGPPVFDLVALVGRPATRQRLDHFIAYLAEIAPTSE
ncbi:MAG: glutamate--tRNA ligase [Acidobacteriota bacterium]